MYDCFFLIRMFSVGQMPSATEVVMRRQHWQDSMVAMIGVWLIASPWVLLYSQADAVGTDVPSLNFVATGFLLIIAGFAALTTEWIWQEWTALAVGFWLIVSPWALQFETVPAAFWNSVASGSIVTMFTTWVLATERVG
jgi:SPW repeat